MTAANFVELEAVDHIGVRITEAAPALAFYKQFGFEKTFEDTDMGIINIQNAAGVELNLDLSCNAAAGENVLMDRGEKYAGYTHLALRIASLTATMRQLEELNIPIVRGPIHYPDGASVFVRDPDGNVLELRSREGLV